ncbi:aminopeptidase [Candidatus Bathyarchaeota archaeon]|nr:MAG: aminopeptidase [Candidatus Bathyarchaeota archaeon]
MPPASTETVNDRQAIARQILDVCLNVKSGEHVWINSWDHTLGLASQLAWECTKRGCEILTTIQQEDLWLRSIIEAPVESLDVLPKQIAAALEKTDVYIYTLGPSRPVPWDKIPKERRKLVTRWFLWSIIMRLQNGLGDLLRSSVGKDQCTSRRHKGQTSDSDLTDVLSILVTDYLTMRWYEKVVWYSFQLEESRYRLTRRVAKELSFLTRLSCPS